MAFGPFAAIPTLKSIVISSGTLIMNGTLIQNFNTQKQLSGLDSLIVLLKGECNITYFSSNNTQMTKGPLIYNVGTKLLLAYSSFGYYKNFTS